MIMQPTFRGKKKQHFFRNIPLKLQCFEAKSNIYQFLHEF